MERRSVERRSWSEGDFYSCLGVPLRDKNARSRSSPFQELSGTALRTEGRATVASTVPGEASLSLSMNKNMWGGTRRATWRLKELLR
ncbi:unnamed protein product [Victoria cruziana]